MLSVMSFMLCSCSECVQTPTKVDGISNVEQVACGNRHTIALDKNGDVYTWGARTNGLSMCSPIFFHRFRPHHFKMFANSWTTGDRDYLRKKHGE